MSIHSEALVANIWCECELIFLSNLAHYVQPMRNQSVEHTNLLNINQHLPAAHSHNAFAIHLNVKLPTRGVHLTNMPRLLWSTDVVRKLHVNAMNVLHQRSVKKDGSYLNTQMIVVVSNVRFFC